MAKPDLGHKRLCQNCGARFFDLNKTPIVCPKCATVFHAAPLTRASARAAAVVDDEVELDPAAAEVVSLEDADAEAKAVETVSDDVEVEDEAAADDTFLEEEEEDDGDVAGLIDGDIESDEEA